MTSWNEKKMIAMMRAQGASYEQALQAMYNLCNSPYVRTGRASEKGDTKSEWVRSVAIPGTMAYLEVYYRLFPDRFESTGLVTPVTGFAVISERQRELRDKQHHSRNQTVVEETQSGTGL